MGKDINMENIANFLKSTDPTQLKIVIGIILFFLLPAIFLNELKKLRDWLKNKIILNEALDKLENYIEPEEKPMENKKYTFGAQLGMGIKWLLLFIGLSIILTVLIEAVKILK